MSPAVMRVILLPTAHPKQGVRRQRVDPVLVPEQGQQCIVRRRLEVRHFQGVVPGVVLVPRDFERREYRASCRRTTALRALYRLTCEPKSSILLSGTVWYSCGPSSAGV